MECKKCSASFENKSQLVNHCRWQHKSAAICLCSKCHKQFKDNSSRSVHEKWCDGAGTKLDKRNKLALWICLRCRYEIKNSRQKHLNCCDGRGPRRTVTKLYGVGRYTEEFKKRVKRNQEKISRRSNI